MTVGDIASIIEAVSLNPVGVLTVPGVVYTGVVEGGSLSGNTLFIKARDPAGVTRRMAIAIEHIVAIYAA